MANIQVRCFGKICRYELMCSSVLHTLRKIFKT